MTWNKNYKSKTDRSSHMSVLLAQQTERAPPACCAHWLLLLFGFSGDRRNSLGSTHSAQGLLLALALGITLEVLTGLYVVRILNSGWPHARQEP